MTSPKSPPFSCFGVHFSNRQLSQLYDMLLSNSVVLCCVDQSSVQNHGKEKSSEDSEVRHRGQHCGFPQGDDEPDL